jgi:GNAT superfamily N-acetyltransferase
MICNISLDEINDAVRIHWKLQLGSYFDSVHDLDGAVYNLGDTVKDYYWNYAGMINTSSEKAEDLITKVEEFAFKNNREPAFYIDPTTKPNNFSDYLLKREYQPDDDEIWMLFNRFPNTLKKSPPNLVINEISSFDEMKVYVDVFHEAYEFLEGQEKTSPYGNSLLMAYRNKPKNVSIHHFIGWDLNEPVSVSSIYVSDTVAGLYNVGTPKKHRNKGYGSALSIHSIKYAQQIGIYDKIILQTELGDDAERLYKTLGFEQAFSAAIWAKKAN